MLLLKFGVEVEVDQWLRLPEANIDDLACCIFIKKRSARDLGVYFRLLAIHQSFFDFISVKQRNNCEP